ncbi:hypothetical protein K466DRAFT_656722, partial [Polyporus arcularius HHB13444]
MVDHEVCDNRMRAGHRTFARYFPEGLKKWRLLVAEFYHQDHTLRNTIDFPPERDRTATQATSQKSGSSGETVRDDGVQGSELETHAGWWRRPSPITLHSLLRGPLRRCCDGSQQGRVQPGPGLASLYRCTWCAKATAMVRKCTGCDTA